MVWKATPWLTFDFAAGSEFGSASNPSRGLFNGGYGTSIRPVIDLGRLRLTGYYVHTYSPNNGIDSLTGSNAAKVVGAGPVVANSYVGAAFYRVLPNFDIGGSVAYSNARALGEGTKGDAQVWNYDINFTLYDLGKKGNMAGLILGVQPRLAGTSSEELARAIGLPPGQRSDRNVGYHIEAFYSHRLSDNITITPGLIWLTAPNHDERNPDVIMGIIRSSFFF
ncbi:MAG TPA: iron uptake porin [Leptolyngbyaceae cyanobacterium]